jgi:hypothetical protein
LAHIPADKGIKRVIFPDPRTLFESFFGNSGDESSVQVEQQRAAFNLLPEDVRRTLRYAALMERMQRGEAMAMMPFELRIR